MKTINETSSNATSYSADGGEPDAGYLPGGDVRTLGLESGKPEPWFDKLDFEQVDFPVADYIYGDKATEKKLGRIVKVSTLISEHEEIKKQYKGIRWRFKEKKKTKHHF